MDARLDGAQAAVRSALRALDLLELLAGRGAPMTHAEIAIALGIPKSSLTLLLRTLAARGYLRPGPAGRGWEVGSAVAALGDAPRRRADLVLAAQPVLARLAAEADESAGLVVLEGSRGRVLAAVNAQHPLTFAYSTGQTLPLHATSSGKALLAALPEAARDACIAGIGFEAFTPATLATAQALRRALESISRGGVALSREERHPGIVGMARAVTTAEGALLGAINVALPALRFDAAAEQRIEAALHRAARTLAARLA